VQVQLKLSAQENEKNIEMKNEMKEKKPEIKETELIFETQAEKETLIISYL